MQEQQRELSGDVAGILDKQEVRGWAECFLGRRGPGRGRSWCKSPEACVMEEPRGGPWGCRRGVGVRTDRGSMGLVGLWLLPQGQGSHRRF